MFCMLSSTKSDTEFSGGILNALIAKIYVSQIFMGESNSLFLSLYQKRTLKEFRFI